MRKILLVLTVFFFPLLFCLETQVLARDVTLQWDANSETDLAGYKVYYKTSPSGDGVLSNYTGRGADEGNSPVDMPLAQDENPDINVVEFTLRGLDDNQTYFFVVTAYNTGELESSASNEAHADSQSSDTMPPVISNVQVSSITYNSAVVTWMSDEQSTSIVQYGTSSGSWGNYPDSAENTSLATSHSITLTGLSGGTTYYFRVGSTDASGNGPTISSQASFTTDPMPDTIPPVISNVQVSSITYNSALVTWVTDEPSTSLVRYGTSSSSWGNYPNSAENTNLATSHSITLTGLSGGTTYYFRVGSTDASGNGPTRSSQATFTTNQPPDTTPPVISNVQVSSITYNSAVVTWVTDEPSTSLVHYGTSSSSWGNYPNSAGDSSTATSHSVSLTGLGGSRAYYFRVGSTDASGNGPTISVESTFATASPPDLEVQGLPVDLTGGTPQSSDVELTILSIPSGTQYIEITMTVQDPDYSNEGRLFINGYGPITLFGTQGVSSNDGISVTMSPIATDPAWYHPGQNILTFWHDSTAGYVVENISVSFVISPPDPPPSGLPCGLRIGER